MKEKNYEFDNAFIDYISGIVDLERLLEEVKFDNNRAHSLFLSMLYCHTISLFDAFVGDEIRFKQYHTNQDVDEKCPYQNSKIISKALKDVYGIEFSLPSEYDYMAYKRNMLIHRNGKLPNGCHIKITEKDVKYIISFVKQKINEIEELICDKQAEENVKCGK